MTMGLSALVKAGQEISSLPEAGEPSAEQLIRSQADAVCSAYDLLGDDVSRELFKDVLSIHASKVPVPLTCRTRAEQYFPADLEIEIDLQRSVFCGMDHEFIDKLRAQPEPI